MFVVVIVVRQTCRRQADRQIDIDRQIDR